MKNKVLARTKLVPVVQCIHVDPELVTLADDLVSAIRKCDPGWMPSPTRHMAEAIDNYLAYKERNHVSAI